MNCIFFGHRDAPDRIVPYLKNAIIQLIEEQGVKHFYTGNNGHFDFLAQKVLKEITKEYEGVKFNIILSSIDELAISGNQDLTLFPEGLEHVPPRFAIFRRNEWMIEHASFVISYTRHKASNTYQWVEKARRKGLCVINLME